MPTRLSLPATVAGFLRGLRNDTRGLILPYVTVMLVVIVGVSVLALDGARYMSLQTQLQNGADALALAGAAELDRLPDAKLRASNAIDTLVTNSSLFGSGEEKKVRVASVQFYSRLPDDDTQPLSGATIAANDMLARFVDVEVRPTAISTILPAALFGGSNTVTSAASAVAGFDQVVCQITPLFVCNPHEIPGMSYEQASRALQAAEADSAIRRRLIRLRQYRGDGKPYVSGDYGFLEPSRFEGGRRMLIDALARVHPPVCFSLRGVDLMPGYLDNASDAINVRFDIYDGMLRGHQNDSSYFPSTNVRKGFAGNACATEPPAFANWPLGSPPNQATGFPLDRTWPYMKGRMGDGDWDFSTYWQVNHGGAGRESPLVDGQPASNSNLPSRYSVYRYEIDHGYVADMSPAGETGNPTCYRGEAPSYLPDRRILNAAIINCGALALSGAAENVPVAAFAKLFLTLPLVQSQSDLYVEMVGLMKPGDPHNFDTVQLYR